MCGVLFNHHHDSISLWIHNYGPGLSIGSRLQSWLLTSSVGRAPCKLVSKRTRSTSTHSLLLCAPYGNVNSEYFCFLCLVPPPPFRNSHALAVHFSAGKYIQYLAAIATIVKCSNILQCSLVRRLLAYGGRRRPGLLKMHSRRRAMLFKCLEPGL